MTFPKPYVGINGNNTFVSFDHGVTKLFSARMFKHNDSLLASVAKECNCFCWDICTVWMHRIRDRITLAGCCYSVYSFRIQNPGSAFGFDAFFPPFQYAGIQVCGSKVSNNGTILMIASPCPGAAPAVHVAAFQLAETSGYQLVYDGGEFSINEVRDATRYPPFPVQTNNLRFQIWANMRKLHNQDCNKSFVTVTEPTGCPTGTVPHPYDPIADAGGGDSCPPVTINVTVNPPSDRSAGLG